MMNIRRLSTTLAVVVVLACAALWAGVSAQQKPAAATASTSADALLGAALHQEEVAGQLEAAIASYRKVLAAADATRAQKAKAQLRIGACYERLGNSEATKAYQAVVRDYADQADAASQARARLVGLTAGGGSTATRADQFAMRELSSVLPAGAEADAEVSPDGQHVAFMDPETDDLSALDLSSGRIRRLTDGKDGEYQLWSFAWSPDSRRLVYDWLPSRGSSAAHQLRVLALAGGEPQVLMATDRGPSPEHWAADGRILVSAGNERERRIAWVTPGAQVLQTLKVISADVGMPSPRVSPGGQFIAYLDWNPASRRRSLRVMRTDGSGDVALLELARPDRFVGWTPDAGGLLLVRAGSGARGADALWLQRVDPAGKAAGEPVLLRDEFPDAAVLGLSRSGTLFFTHRSGSTNLYVADLDPASGTVKGRPTRFSEPSESVIWGPGWSPDGALLAYGTSRANGPGNALTIRSIDGKSSRQISLPASPSTSVPPQWLPDSRSVAFVAYANHAKGRDAGVFRVDVTSGEIATMLEPGTGILVSTRSPKEPNSNLGALSPDGRVAYVRHYRYGADGKQIPALIAHPLDGGASTTLFEGQQGGIQVVAVSPDGRRIGFVTTGGVHVVSAQGGDVRAACQGMSIGGNGLAWSPDGRWLFAWAQARPGNKPPPQIARCSVDDGKIDKMELAGIQAEFLRQLAVNPNGRQIAFTATSPQKPANVWVLENFLPTATKK